MGWQPDLAYNAVLCRYNEIGTKGKNRIRFEEQLADALRRAFSVVEGFRFVFEHGRIFIVPGDGRDVFSAADLAVFRSRAVAVSGLASLSPGFLVAPDMEHIEECVLRYFPTVCESFLGQTPAMEPSYAMRARRCDKAFPMTCSEVELHFAEKLLPQYPQLHVDLKHANLVVEVDIRYKHAFISFERVAGPGGLPSGSGGHVLALLSGGIDSPVACYEMMRRGCTVDFLTFHSEPYTPPAYITKVLGIVKTLNGFQKRGKVVSINMVEAQKQIRDLCSDKHRTVLYRRFMMRLASIVASKMKDQALVTGDNLGQVASQTLENMNVINSAVSDMILRPLLTFDKLDIMAIAQKIGTFEQSLVDVPDSCTVFAPKAPTTAAILANVLEDEARLDIPKLLQICLENTVIINPNNFKTHNFLECMSYED